MNIRVNLHAGCGSITGTECASDETIGINVALYWMFRSVCDQFL